MPNHTRHDHTYSDSHIHILVAHNLEHMCNALLFLCPLGLTFTCWGCYDLCPTYSNRACPLSFIPFLCISVFMALSTVFHSINSPDNSPLSHSVLTVFFLPNWPFNYVSLYESLPQPWYDLLCLTGFKTTTNKLTIHSWPWYRIP